MSILSINFASPLQWHKADGDDPHDFCALAGFEIVAFGRTLLSNDDGIWNAFAAVAQMVATTAPTFENPDPHCQQMIPCCGQTFYFDEKSGRFHFVCCATGFTWNVYHRRASIALSEFTLLHCDNALRQESLEVELTRAEYVGAILPLVRSLREFYERDGRLTPDPKRQGTPHFLGIWTCLDRFLAAES